MAFGTFTVWMIGSDKKKRSIVIMLQENPRLRRQTDQIP